MGIGFGQRTGSSESPQVSENSPSPTSVSLRTSWSVLVRISYDVRDKSLFKTPSDIARALQALKEYITPRSRPEGNVLEFSRAQNALIPSPSRSSPSARAEEARQVPERSTWTERSLAPIPGLRRAGLAAVLQGRSQSRFRFRRGKGASFEGVPGLRQSVEISARRDTRF